MSEPERIYMFPLWVRIWHWVNALLIIVLIVSGISLHFPRSTAMVMSFSLARDVHNVAGLALCATWVIFVIANIITGNWWQFIPKPAHYVRNVLIQIRFYVWDVFLGRPHPFPATLESNFNVLQTTVYWVVMYLITPLVLLSGTIYLFPELAPDRIMGVDGLLPIAILHYLSGLAIVLFFLSHIYLITMGHTPTSLLKAMITGWHEK
jgi:thiosulfate reductase cytochrome b subunit